MIKQSFFIFLNCFVILLFYFVKNWSHPDLTKIIWIRSDPNLQPWYHRSCNCFVEEFYSSKYRIIDFTCRALYSTKISNTVFLSTGYLCGSRVQVPKLNGWNKILRVLEIRAYILFMRMRLKNLTLIFIIDPVVR